MTLFRSSLSCSEGVALKFTFILMLVFFQYGTNKIYVENNYSWLITIVVWFVGLYSVRGSLPVVFIFIFILSYVAVPFYFFVLDKQIGIYDDFQSIEYINKVSFLNTLFISVLTLFLNRINDSSLMKPSKWLHSNRIVFYISLLPCILSVYFGISGESLLTSGYGTGASEKSPLHEYFILFIFFPLIYKEPDSKWHGLIIFAIILVYSLKTIIYGGRVEVLQAGLLYFYLSYNYFKDISKIKLYIFGILMFSVMSLLGAIRGNVYQIISAPDVSDIFELIFLSNDSNPYLLSTSGDIYYASMRMLGMINLGVLDFETRVISFFSFVFNVFLSFSSLKDNANLASFNSDVYRVGGGGLISVYFYVWLGYLGVILSSSLIGYSIKRFHNNSGVFYRVYGFMLLVTFPRWWGYTPLNLSKLCIIAVIFYFLYRIISVSMSKSIVGYHDRS
jgi:hypothetical protein